MQTNPIEARTVLRRGAYGGCLGMVGVGALFLCIGSGLAVWGWTIYQNARASADWPTAQGKVTSSHVSHTTDSDGGDSYSPSVRYEYQADDRRYANNTIKFGENSYNSFDEAQVYVARYPEGATVTVYYDPGKPGRSVLEPGVSAGSFIVLGIGVFFVVIALGLGGVGGAIGLAARRAGAA
jgi:Protein of unknown function (DUF3592)